MATGRPADGTGAFFDMDKTVLSDSSGMLYVRYLRRTGQMSAIQWARIMLWTGRYVAGMLDFPHLMARLLSYAAGSSEAEAWRTADQFFETMLRDAIADGARERIAWHRERGHHVAIVSAATPYAVQHVATELGLAEAYLATRLEVIDGQFSGRIVEPACYGHGKVLAAQAYAQQHGLDLARSFFYSDSASDLPLLEAVGYPVAVNPSRRLAWVAGRRGWPVMKFY